MTVEEKQPRVIKLAKSTVRRKRLMYYGLYVAGFALVIIVVLLLNHKTPAEQKTGRSKKLTGTIKSLEDGSHSCSDGLKHVGSMGSQVANSTQYTNATREVTLDYLMTCNFEEGNTKQALLYANTLEQLYAQDGNTQKHQSLSQFVIYMKTYHK